ncbi:putative membrane protein [Moraxella catarrhalis]|uniref:Membrane protein n=1 Tax=Moraxella catarrhalis TaxID=480 RepID=A0A3S9QDB8_MORCA|nr:putative membrane protein [Moraxella catarrhalis BBH18]AZQ86541.1 putative membrane protein [Moraxella catarrhalis]EKF83888.1 hypothetical protein MCRH_0401 [Moraxella catarrhalis RH4]AZQ89380.1 putative membrane protein [Moraxella catarrhalis]AZQ90783.1 putative membrane protein [Moraxella catarrhalis]
MTLSVINYPILAYFWDKIIALMGSLSANVFGVTARFIG